MGKSSLAAQLMGIINVTPDSFSGSSQACDISAVIEIAERHLSEGATILDIGGCSTRPNGSLVSAEEERQRVMPALAALNQAFPDVILSLDTFRSSIAAEAIDLYGVKLINDISGAEWDRTMIDVVGSRHAKYILSYMPYPAEERFTPYSGNDIIADMTMFFMRKIELLHKAGTDDIILDPGFGFAKTTAQNYEVLYRLNELKTTGYPILVGLSRKSMIYKVLNTTPEYSLNGTTALHTIALMNGANILRVHDTKEAKEAITLYEHLTQGHN
ncbi:MAG: dihydropteroate synthase [Paludibacteraceae bacterium]|nr:dihydropteroate synthase [Paludibacteraceae bacterium]